MLKLSRRVLLAGAAFLRAGFGRADTPPSAALIARREMAVQVVDFGWHRDGDMFDSAGPDGAITNEIYTLETAPHHVRFRFQNGLTQGWTISGAAYAGTAAPQSNPVDANGAPVALLPVTFGNNGQDVALADQLANAAAPTNLVLPPAAAGGTYQKNGYGFRGVPTIVFSDWMAFTPTPRNDGGPGCLVMLRVQTSDPAFTGVRPTWLHNQPLFQGTAARPWRALYAPAGQGATLTGGFDDPQPVAAYFGNGLCCGVQAIGDTPGLTLLSVGDSALMGGGEAQGYLGSIKRAADLMSTPQLPVSHVESAIFGCPSGAFYAQGREAVRTNKISCAFIQVMSGNDPHTMQAAQKSFAAALTLADYCRQQGTLTVFISPGPPRVLNQRPKMDEIHAWVMASLKRMAAQGYLFLDLYAALGAGSVDEAEMQLKPGLRAEDDVHLNSAGDTLVANAAVALLRGLPVQTA